MVENSAVMAITTSARMIDRASAPCRSPIEDGSSSFSHQ